MRCKLLGLHVSVRLTLYPFTFRCGFADQSCLRIVRRLKRVRCDLTRRLDDNSLSHDGELIEAPDLVESHRRSEPIGAAVARNFLWKLSSLRWIGDTQIDWGLIYKAVRSSLAATRCASYSIGFSTAVRDVAADQLDPDTSRAQLPSLVCVNGTSRTSGRAVLELIAKQRLLEQIVGGSDRNLIVEVRKTNSHASPGYWLKKLLGRSIRTLPTNQATRMRIRLDALGRHYTTPRRQAHRPWTSRGVKDIESFSFFRFDENEKHSSRTGPRDDSMASL